jgi:hypothetical protein
MHEDEEHETKRIGNDRTLASLNFLAGVIAANTATFAGLDRLAVDDACCRAGFAAFDLSSRHDQQMVDGLP